MMVLLIELHLLTLLSVTVTLFQGHSANSNWKFLCSYLVKLKLCTIVNYIDWNIDILLFVVVFVDFCTYSRDVIGIFPDTLREIFPFAWL